jgi:hypothetical protein
VRTGFEGTLELTAGLAASETRTFSLTDPDGSAFPEDDPAERDQTKAFELTVPEDAVTGRIATFDADHDPGTDLDLFVYARTDDGSLELVDSSMEGGSNEHVDLEPGRTYVAYLDLYEAPTGTVAALAHTWIVPGTSGELTVDPASVEATTGSTHTLTAAWTGLDPDRRYLGTIGYLADGAVLGRTLVVLNH